MPDTWTVRLTLRQLDDGNLSVGCNGLSPGQSLIVDIQTPKRQAMAGFIGALGGTRALRDEELSSSITRGDAEEESRG